MTLLWCPICGGEALEKSKQELAPVSASAPNSDSDIFVCHCADGHRFVMSSHAECLENYRGHIDPVSC